MIAAVRWCLLLALLGCSGRGEHAGPVVLRVQEKDGHLDLPGDWLSEDPALVGELPRRAKAFSEGWDLLAHVYTVTYERSEAAAVKAVLTKRGATDREMPMVAGDHRRLVLASIPSTDEQADVMFVAQFEDTPPNLGAIIRSLPPLASLQPVLEKLGSPSRVVVTLVATTPLDVQVDYPLAGLDLDATGKLLIANGFNGDRAAGWTIIPASGPRVIVELGHEPVKGTEVLTVEALGTK
jgi:hypothetical protein